MEMDLRTPKEKERDVKHERICQMYLSLSNEQPEAAPHRIFLAIANQNGMTTMGVRRIVERAGLYQGRR
jgi:hypothetical protein